MEYFEDNEWPLKKGGAVSSYRSNLNYFVYYSPTSKATDFEVQEVR